jgi:hypothetical protein
MTAHVKITVIVSYILYYRYGIWKVIDEGCKYTFATLEIFIYVRTLMRDTRNRKLLYPSPVHDDNMICALKFHLISG